MNDAPRTPLEAAALRQAYDDREFRALLLHTAEPAEILALLRREAGRDAVPPRTGRLGASTAARREFATG